MASTSSHLQEILRCPVCLGTMFEPRMFVCGHFCCRSCVEHLEQEHEGDSVGHRCPLCRRFTPLRDLKALPLMTQIIETVARNDADSECDHCDERKRKWRCVECKCGYCDACRVEHSNFKYMRSHTMEKISASTKPIIDELIFCQVHTSKPVEFHCRDCEQLICALCNGTTHKQHTAETIEEALQQILPVFRGRQLNVKAMIEATKAEIAEAKNKQDSSSTTGFAAVLEDLMEERDEILMKVVSDYDKLCKEISSLKKKLHARHESRIQQLELQLLSQENILSLSQSTLDTSMNASLFNTLKSGDLNTMFDTLENTEAVPEVREFTAELYPNTDAAQINLLGSIQMKEIPNSNDDSEPDVCLATQGLPNISGELNITCEELREKVLTLQSQHSMVDTYYSRFGVINGELWCAVRGTNTIRVYTTDEKCTPQCIVTSPQLKHARSVSEFCDKALISAKSGLFVASRSAITNEVEVTSVFVGNFCDATVKDHQVFVLENKQGMIYECQARETNNELSFIKRTEFPLLNYEQHSSNTIQVTSSHLFVCLSEMHMIQQYSFDGKLIQEHGEFGKNIDQLCRPFLSGCDALGNVLIADHYNSRLVCLRRDGSFRAVPIPDLVQYPTCARIHRDKLYVMLCSSNSLSTLKGYSLA